MLAIPYSRVSSADQAGGLGLDRQAADPAAYCAARGWELWEGPGYSDAGVSAYGGKNLSAGALGRFLADAKAGRFGIEPLALLIEDLDRFSRSFPLAVLPVLVDDVLNAGLTIAVMGKGRDISRESIKQNQMELHELLFWLGGAHDFSEKLSKRISHVHATKREQLREGKAVAAHAAPAWIDLDASGRWVLNDYAAVIRRVVEMATEGHGLYVIATKFNAEGIPSPGQYRREQWATSAKRRSKEEYKPVRWTSASVRQVLQAPALIGDRRVLKPGHKTRLRDWQEECALQRRKGAAEENLPKAPIRTAEEPQRNYYPAICTEAEQASILSAMARRKPQNLGQVAKLAWLAQGLTTCSCGAPIGAVSSCKPPQKRYYLRCKGRQKGSGCQQMGRRLLEVQAHLLTRLRSDSFLAMIEEQSGGAKTSALVAAITRQANAQAAVDHQEAARKAGEVALEAQTDGAVLGVLARRQVNLEASLEKARLDLREAQAEVQQLQGRPGDRVLAVEAQEKIRSLLETFSRGEDTIEDRRAVRHHLERLGLRVILDATDQRLALAIGDREPDWQPLHGGAAEALAEGRSGLTYATGYISETSLREAMARITANNLSGDELIVVDVECSRQMEDGIYEQRITPIIHDGE